MNKPKVIFLGPLPPPYMGPSLATRIILKSTLADSFDLVHLDTSHHEDLSTLGVVGMSNILAALRHYLMLVTLIVRERPDAVYIPISQTTVGYLKDSIFIILAKLFFRKVICHLRGGNFRRWYEGASPPMRLYIRAVQRLVDIQIVLGDKLRSLFMGVVPEHRIYVVPNGRDFNWSEAKRENGGGKKRVLYLSNFIKTKGVLDVFHSIPYVIKQFEDVEFIFAGAWLDQDVKDDIQKAMAEHPEYPVEIVGIVSGEKKFELIKSADIFAFPTYYPPEGHPWSIVEAMAAGLPIISTDQGAITESVIDGVNGFIVEKQNPSDVAEKILRLCQDRELSRKMGEESRRLYEREFTEKKMVERMSVAFNAALDGRRKVIHS